MLSFDVIFFFYPRYKLQCVEFHYKRLYGVYATTMAAIMVINYIPPLKNICSLLLVILGMWLKQHLVVVNAWSYDRRDDLFGFDTFESKLVGSMSSKLQLGVYLEKLT